MARYFINLSYNGSKYHGWQIQPNGISVQETVNQRMSTLLREKIEVTGAGRTDSGVHAKMMIAHFDYNGELKNLVFRLNSIMPKDIYIKSVTKVKENAHARYDATSRTYEYWLTMEKNPFHIDTYSHVYGPLDFEAMNEAAKELLHHIDFTSFSKIHTDVKTNDCKITKAIWEQKSENVWVFTITADRFLRNMVRAIVGTLIDIGRHKMKIKQFKKIIEAKDRKEAGFSAPAEGLYLTNITYPKGIFLL